MNDTSRMAYTLRVTVTDDGEPDYVITVAGETVWGIESLFDIMDEWAAKWFECFDDMNMWSNAVLHIEATVPALDHTETRKVRHQDVVMPGVAAELCLFPYVAQEDDLLAMADRIVEEIPDAWYIREVFGHREVAIEVIDEFRLLMKAER